MKEAVLDIAEIGHLNDELRAVYSRVMEDIENVNGYFVEKQKIRERNFRFYMGDQWTPQEEAAIRRQFRLAYKFNEIQHKVEHIIGSYTQTRMDVKCLPREYSDSAGAELLNFILKWAEQVSRYEYVEREVFRDGIVGAWGAAIVRWNVEDVVNGYPVVEKIPADELIWDINSKDIELKDARWMARIMYASKREAKDLFPGYEDIIDKAVSAEGQGELGIPPSVRQLRALNNSHYYDPEKDIIQIVEHYEKESISQYIVIDEISGNIKSFDDKGEAEEYYSGLVDGYIDNGEVLDNPDGTSRVLIEVVKKQVYWQTVLVQNFVLRRQLTDLPDFPFVVFFAYHHDGEPWSFVDNLIDPQILINRSFSTWDYQLGAATKNMVTVIPQLLMRGFSLYDFVRESSKNKPIIPVVRHDAVMQHPSQQALPQLFDNISFGIQRMNDYAGGRNTLGLQENAAESGRAVIARAEQGGLGRLPLFDNLKFWKRGVAERLVWWIKNYMSPGQVLRIIGEDKTVKFVELDDGILDTLQEVKVDIIVEEVSKSETVNERYFQQLKELFSVMPGVPPEVILRIMVPYTSLPESKKEEIMATLGGFMEYMNMVEKQKKEQKLVSQVQDSVIKKRLKEQMLQQDELQNNQNKIDIQQKQVKKKLDELQEMQEELEKGRLSAIINQINSKEDMQNFNKASMLNKLM